MAQSWGADTRTVHALYAKSALVRNCTSLFPSEECFSRSLEAHAQAGSCLKYVSDMCFLCYTRRFPLKKSFKWKSEILNVGLTRSSHAGQCGNNFGHVRHSLSAAVSTRANPDFLRKCCTGRCAIAEFLLFASSTGLRSGTILKIEFWTSRVNSWSSKTANSR